VRQSARNEHTPNSECVKPDTCLIGTTIYSSVKIVVDNRVKHRILAIGRWLT